MSSQVKAEIVSIGSELLMGEIADTNASYIASQLPLLGIGLGRVTVVGDDKKQLSQVFRQALKRAGLVIASGGLGPTEDDLTRESLAEVLEEKLTVDPEVEKWLRSRFARLNREMPPSNIQQAMLIPSACSIDNERGTAPGWWVEKGGKVIITLPGPPRELQPMWQKEIKPRLQKRFPGPVILTRTLKTFGVPEAKVGEMAEPLFSLGNPALGIYAKPDGVQLRLIAHGENAPKLLQDAEREIERIFAGSLWGKEDDTLPDIIGRWLTAKKLSLATLEDGTRGILATMISSAGGSPKYYSGSLVTCSPEARVATGVPEALVKQHGAASIEVAKEMAVLARQRFSTDFGLSTTGIAGLDGEKEKTPGLAYVGFADSQSATGWQQNVLPYSDAARSQLAIAAVFRLRQKLMELKISM